MKIILAGGSGHLGRLLARSFQETGDEVVILSRSPRPAGNARVELWAGRTLGPWAAELEGADVVINLAGRSVNCRYGVANRRAIKESRLESTATLGQAMALTTRPPRVWLQSSTATIYAHRYDAPNGETDGRLGGDEPGLPDAWRFSLDVAHSWEQAALLAKPPATRQVLLRSAVVMSPEPAGPFAILLRLVRLGLGGRSGDGRQMVSWVHDRDFVRAIRWLIDNDDLCGPVNLAAPEPLPNAAFMRLLREAWGRRFGLPSPATLLEFGAFFLRTETELVLKSRYVVPEKLLASGFSFDFPSWQEASQDLCRRVKAKD